MDPTNYKNIWIFAECRNEEPLPVYYELLSKAKEIASAQDSTRVCSVLIGSGTEKALDQIAASGTDVVYVADHIKLESYNCEYYSTVLERMINTFKPESFLIGATSAGSELAPSVAAKVRTGVAAHCVDITTNEKQELVCMVPAFGGKIVSEILIPKCRPQIASVRPGILSVAEQECGKPAEIIRFDCSFLEDVESDVELIDFKPAENKGQKLEDAEIVVCAGRGISTDEAWDNINKLAKRLNAPVAYTRAFIDNGYVNDETDVLGTSGKSIKPKVCLTFGSSGAMHFVCGILKSKMIISVNRDENAKIFDMSDAKVISDANKILEAMLRKLG